MLGHDYGAPRGPTMRDMIIFMRSFLPWSTRWDMIVMLWPRGAVLVFLVHSPTMRDMIMVPRGGGKIVLVQSPCLSHHEGHDYGAPSTYQRIARQTGCGPTMRDMIMVPRAFLALPCVGVIPSHHEGHDYGAPRKRAGYYKPVVSVPP